MATRTISISVIGDRDYIKKMKILGLRMDKSISALVRDALDAHYGDQLSRINLQLVDKGENADATKTTDPR